MPMEVILRMGLKDGGRWKRHDYKDHSHKFLFLPIISHVGFDQVPPAYCQLSLRDDKVNPPRNEIRCKGYLWISKGLLNPHPRTMGTDSIPAIEDVAPLEILQSRVATRTDPSAGPGAGSSVSGEIKSLPPRMPVLPKKPHRSFILMVRARLLAEAPCSH